MKNPSSCHIPYYRLIKFIFFFYKSVFCFDSVPCAVMISLCCSADVFTNELLHWRAGGAAPLLCCLQALPCNVAPQWFFSGLMLHSCVVFKMYNAVLHRSGLVLHRWTGSLMHRWGRVLLPKLLGYCARGLFHYCSTTVLVWFVSAAALL